MEAIGFLGLFGTCLAIASAVLAFFIPFMVYFMLQHLKAISAATYATQQSIKNIERNIYLEITK